MTAPVLELVDVLPGADADAWEAPLDLTVAAGSFTTLVTTPAHAAALFRVLLGLDAPRAGRVAVLGEEPHRLRREPLRRLRRRIGSSLLPDGLIANITLRANVALPLVFGDGWSNHASLERADEVLDRFGLARWADRRPPDLAPDTRQVASLARAVASRPELLLLHDPLTSVSNADAVHLLTLCRALAGTVVAAVHGEDEAVCLMADHSSVWDGKGVRTSARTGSRPAVHA
jgi:ABC-type methionine transport system ATPase subunit